MYIKRQTKVIIQGSVSNQKELWEMNRNFIFIFF